VTSDEFDAWLTQPAQTRRPLVMGVLNVTPDSFSDGGRFQDPQVALEHAQAMVRAGADWIDIGGESTRPGSQPTPAQEQLRRILPVIRAVRAALSTLVSIDTTRGEVAEAALDAGADLVNDISAGRDDPAMLPLVARRNAAIILMHMQGTPATMQISPTYRDVTAEVAQFLIQRRDTAVAAGIDSRRILLDPGLGFGKTLSHNLQLLNQTATLAALGHPLVVGPSRKGFVSEVTGQAAPDQRLFGTAAAVAWAVTNGAAVVRVHDVGPIAQILRMVHAIQVAKNADFLKD
jgi:dihydropteroate synthase